MRSGAGRSHCNEVVVSALRGSWGFWEEMGYEPSGPPGEASRYMRKSL